MIYVVHTTRDRKRRYFTEFRPAFKVFREAMRDTYGDVALWYGSDYTSWTRVYSSVGYPEKLTKPRD